jgi:hypothetical protein
MRRLSFYEHPDRNARVLKSDFEIGNKGFTLIEIGKFDRTGDESRPFDIWYRIKNANIDGWVLGLVSMY